MLAARLATGGCALRPNSGQNSRLLLAVAPAAGHPCKGAGCGLPPQQGVWPWSVALAEGLVMADRPLSSLLSL
ncbi:hypothetical protein BHE74_00035188 [Ensete ventricosum]|nr:hypothetical protein BHE74_00035188 [Ensete ventricosum]RZS03448.1 hypothetical protein BHM03_00033633 [Ensete ventricosum]